MQDVHAKLQKMAYFSASFRAMFFLCALAGVFLPKFFIAFFLNKLNYQGVFKSIVEWHSHEMIFGFTMALLSGFLLTASINWSGNRMRNGFWLLALTVFWLLERIAFAAPISTSLAIAFNLPFMVLFIIMSGLQLKGNRNFKILMPVLLALFLAKELLVLGNLFENQAAAWAGRDLALGLIRYLLAIFACRLIPFFSSKRLPKSGAINIPLALRGTFLTSLLLSDTLKACFNFLPVINHYLDVPLAVAIVSGLWIWKLMRPLQTAKEPMILILNIGFFWLLLSCVGELLGHHLPSLEISSIPIHLLTTGALGCFSLGMMARISLAHTGRMMKAGKMILAIFILANLGALARVIIPLIANQFYLTSLHTITGLWVGAYFLFLIAFTKILWTPQQGLSK